MWGRFWFSSFSGYENGYTEYMDLMVPLGIMSTSEYGITLGTPCFGAHPCCCSCFWLLVKCVTAWLLIPLG